MRRELLTLALLAWATLASAQPTIVGSSGQACTTGVTSCQVAAGVTAQSGDLVVAVLAVRLASTTLTVSASDATNGSYTCPAGANLFGGATSTQTAICYVLSSGAASIQPTVTVSGGTVNSLYVGSLVVRDATWSLDQTNEATFTSGTGPFSHGSITTAATNGVVVASAAQSTGVTDETEASGFTQFADQLLREFFQYRVTTGSVTTSAGYTSVTTHAGVGAIVAFSSSGGGSSTCGRGITLMGAGQCE